MGAQAPAPIAALDEPGAETKSPRRQARKGCDVKYRVNRAYASGRFGPWGKGQVVELNELDAAWVNRDSPGVLEAIETETRALESPPHDRQIKRAREKR